MKCGKNLRHNSRSNIDKVNDIFVASDDRIMVRSP